MTYRRQWEWHKDNPHSDDLAFVVERDGENVYDALDVRPSIHCLEIHLSFEHDYTEPIDHAH